MRHGLLGLHRLRQVRPGLKPAFAEARGRISIHRAPRTAHHAPLTNLPRLPPLPRDTYQPGVSDEATCTACPAGSSTRADAAGDWRSHDEASDCILAEPTLLPTSEPSIAKAPCPGKASSGEGESAPCLRSAAPLDPRSVTRSRTASCAHTTPPPHLPPNPPARHPWPSLARIAAQRVASPTSRTRPANRTALPAQRALTYRPPARRRSRHAPSARTASGLPREADPRSSARTRRPAQRQAHRL